jgi:hypothetical protein
MLKRSKDWPIYKVTTTQVGHKLLLLDGHNPLRYVDLATNKVHTYPTKKGIVKVGIKDDSST